MLHIFPAANQLLHSSILSDFIPQKVSLACGGIELIFHFVLCFEILTCLKRDLVYSFVVTNIFVVLLMGTCANLNEMDFYVLGLIFMLLLSLLLLRGVFHSRKFSYAFILYYYNKNPQDILYLLLFSYCLICVLNNVQDQFFPALFKYYTCSIVPV